MRIPISSTLIMTTDLPEDKENKAEPTEKREKHVRSSQLKLVPGRYYARI